MKAKGCIEADGSDVRFDVLGRGNVEGPVAGLDNIDLQRLAIDAPRNCGLAFSDVSVRFQIL